MSDLSITNKNFATAGTMTAAQFNTNMTDIENWCNGSGNINTARLANGAVTEAKLADSAVATAKIEDDAVTAAKIGTDVEARYVVRNPQATSPDYSTTGSSRAFTDWDLSSIVPTNCVAVAIQIRIKDNEIGDAVAIRPDGSSETSTGVLRCTSIVSAKEHQAFGVVAMETDGTSGQTVELYHDAISTVMDITVVGWFIKGTAS